MRHIPVRSSYRRSSIVGAGIAAVLAAGLLAAPVGAQETDGPPSVESLCVPVDRELEELSGLIVADEVVYAIPDGGSSVAVAELANVLAGDCTVTRWLRSELNPFDPEDLTARGDRLWIADVGDNRAARETIALLSVDRDGANAVLHRLRYPEGARDAETILLDRVGMPIIVTKGVGVGEVYVPEGGTSVDDLPSPGPVDLVKAGELTFSMTETPGGPIGPFGSVLATGGAVNAEGTIAAVRTYTDVYFYADEDGDLLDALTRDPVVLPIPNEPQGEAIAFTADGDLLTASELGFPITGDPARPPDANEPLPPIQILRGVEDYVWSQVAQRAATPEPADDVAVPTQSDPAGAGTVAEPPPDDDALDSFGVRVAAVGVGLFISVLIAGATVLWWRRK
ncbi:hypothetical protein [Hoyosella subflava]|uniref:Uncharacterized protein n=1 Tax=Hoyosella subflava (strain DSM 45089 / JCM 17490 / NBRC 109087 / DQS3-9A1) TaxID=443218 RepID=F6EKN9_HOYSD|nr:hypothetical protein [Hoyosella subflava]AEF40175.1 hypothetical protein AS9A_1726 [Hoyosella subflava DQS3-9A1]